MNLKKIKFPILFRLTLLMSLLLVSIALVIAWKNSTFFENVSEQREESSNLTDVKVKAYQVETLMKSYIDKITFFSLDLIKEENAIEFSNVIVDKFNRDVDLLALEIKEKVDGRNISLRYIVNESYINKEGLSEDYFFKKENLKLNESFSGKIKIENMSSKFPLLKISIPLIKNDFGLFSHIAIAYLRIDRLQKSFNQSGAHFTFLVNDSGDVMSHPDQEMVLGRKSFLNHPMVKDAINSKIKIKQKYYETQKNKTFLGSYTKAMFGLTIVSGTTKESIQAPAEMAKGQSYYWLGMILSGAFFLIFVFSSTITNPIEKLKIFTDEVAKGNFEVVASDEVNSRDEVGDLARSFDKMISGLKERDQIKNMFNKFHGSSITEDLLNTELDREGSRKKVTVFFSDIRGFTDFSEHHTAEEVVEMLNDYFEAMVSAILRNNGVVDKFIGDAIMAVWGIPNQKEGNLDSIDCLNACIDMRIALVDYNKKRIAAGKPIIKIGMGVHSGDAISGTIGASERMEYTVIGDTVNTAARIEASTKAFGTDLLISDELYNEVKDHFIATKAGESEVKGKENNLVLYTVQGRIHADGTKEIIETEYSSYTAGSDAKVKIAA